MTKSFIKSLPIFVILISLIGIVFLYQKNQTIKDKAQELINQTISPSQLDSTTPEITPEPTQTTIIPGFNSQETKETISPAADQTDQDESQDQDIVSGSQSQITYTTTKTTVCTPVYGAADSCVEHLVVDTGAQDSLAYTFSALSYITGLLAFVKAKKQ